MSQKTTPEVFEMADPAVFESSASGDGKRMAWLAALALMAVVIGAMLALVVGETPSEAPRVSVVR